jgi:hypothetical protein
MTHDELLAEIDQWLTHSEIAKGQPNKAINVLKALRSIVELHTPEQEIGGGCDENGEELWVCTHCRDGYGFQDYPCLTIQAIQEEINHGV